MVRSWILGKSLPQFGVVKTAASLLGAHIPGGVIQGDDEAQGRLFPLHRALEVADWGEETRPPLTWITTFCGVQREGQQCHSI